MRNKFIKWLSGTHPEIVGAWWGRVGVCLVRKQSLSEAEETLEAIYEPCGIGAVNDLSVGPPTHKEIVNALRCAFERLGNVDSTLALGVASGDIFIKNIEIPTGLTVKQIEQLSVVEAVSNLPVPPEEICADFIRKESAHSSINERIDVAFCKRGFVDELSILAEDAGVSLSIVDRDIQAIHDATLWCAARNGMPKIDVYPLGIILAGETATFQICRSDLDLVSFQINSLTGHRDSLVENVALIKQELISYCRRAGLTDENREPLAHLFVIDELEALGGIGLEFEGLAESSTTLKPRELLRGDCREAPLYGLMVAAGMSLRTSV